MGNTIDLIYYYIGVIGNLVSLTLQDPWLTQARIVSPLVKADFPCFAHLTSLLSEPSGRLFFLYIHQWTTSLHVYVTLVAFNLSNFKTKSPLYTTFIHADKFIVDVYMATTD